MDLYKWPLHFGCPDIERTQPRRSQFVAIHLKGRLFGQLLRRLTFHLVQGLVNAEQFPQQLKGGSLVGLLAEWPQEEALPAKLEMLQASN